MTDWSAEETDNPLLADDRNFYKVEKWSKDDQRVERQAIFNAEIKRRPRIRLTIAAIRYTRRRRRAA
jgi:hypothetical protein